MTDYVHRHHGPRVVVRGIDNALPLDIYSTASVQQTLTAATVSIWLGGRQIVDGVAATTLGPPASYTIPAATTSGEDFSSEWIEQWTTTLNGATEYFDRRGFLIRRPWRSTIIDTDLTDRHSGLASLRPSSITTFEKWREMGRKKLEVELLKKGLEPHKIKDAWMYRRAEIAASLHAFFTDAVTGVGTLGQYQGFAMQYKDEFESEFRTAKPRYDNDQSGLLDTGENKQVGTQAPLIFTAGPVNPIWPTGGTGQ